MSVEGVVPLEVQLERIYTSSLSARSVEREDQDFRDNALLIAGMQDRIQEAVRIYHTTPVRNITIFVEPSLNTVDKPDPLVE